MQKTKFYLLALSLFLLSDMAWNTQDALALSDTSKSDAIESGTAKSDTVKSDTVKSDTVKSDTVKSNTRKLDASKSNAVKSMPAPLKGTVTENQLIDNLERVGIKCIIQQQGNGKRDLIIQSVRMGSTAYYKGVAEGDKVKALSTAADLFTLSIERNGQPFQVQLHAMRPELASATPLKGNAKREDKPLTGPLMDVNENKIPKVDVAEKQKKLLQYDIELLVDITGSMNEVDGTDGKTKFAWCHDQVRDFAKVLGEYQKTFTITTFNTSFSTETQCNANRLENIYASITPTGNTDLIDPLVARLEDAYNHKAPGHAVLIAVITDGLPNVPKDPTVVNQALIKFTQKMQKQDDVVITFLQIGDTFKGKDFCIDLDDHLVAEGAKYDIVDTRTFDDLKEKGMIEALVDAITESRTASSKTPHAQRSPMSTSDSMRIHKMDGELQQKQQERESLENILHVKKPNK